MKLVSYQTEGAEQLGVFAKGHIYNLHSCDKLIPHTMSEFLAGGVELMDRAKSISAKILSGELDAKEEVGTCILTGNPSNKRVLFARAY